jgi:hypothetical protein
VGLELLGFASAAFASFRELLQGQGQVPAAEMSNVKLQMLPTDARKLRGFLSRTRDGLLVCSGGMEG